MVVYSLVQVEHPVDRQLGLQLVAHRLVAVQSPQHDLRLVRRLDRGMGVQRDRRVENGPSVQVRVGTDVRSPSGQTDSKRGFASVNHGYAFGPGTDLRPAGPRRKCRRRDKDSDCTRFFQPSRLPASLPGRRCFAGTNRPPVGKEMRCGTNGAVLLSCAGKFPGSRSKFVARMNARCFRDKNRFWKNPGS